MYHGAGAKRLLLREKLSYAEMRKCISDTENDG